MTIDKILISIFQRAFKSISDEMSISLTKTTRSPILCEAKDFVTGLYDAKGQMLEQTENLPILSFSLGPVCKVILDQYGKDIYPGDVIIHNDVFSMGNQNNDVAIFKPIFHKDILVGWAAAKGHQADIGGAVQGGYNPNATEVWQEAIRIPAVKLVEKGNLRKDVWNLIFANIRLQMVQEDIKAQIGACTLGERRLQTFVEKYGLEVFESHKQALFDSTEKMMRAEIKSIPNGIYKGGSMVYYDGKHKGSKFPIRTEITVKNEEIIFDFSKSSPQTKGFVNGTYTSTCSAITLTFLQMVNPNIPHNEGMIKPLKYIVPEGTILNASYPAATTFGNHLCPQVADAIFKALGPAVPERITAGWNHLLCSLFTGNHPRTGKKYVDICFLGMKGGSGAMKGDDGYDHIGMIDASGGVLDQDYEMYEQQTPHLIMKHEYLCDSAGAGEWRGGLGTETEILLRGGDLTMVVFGDGDVETNYGLFGGKGSVLNKIGLEYKNGKKLVPMSKDMIHGVPDKTMYLQIAGGGGGYGNPKKRNKEKVRQDVKNGVVSKKAAEKYTDSKKINMTHEVIQPDGWLSPKGYSNGILAASGRILFLAGQVGWSAEEKFASDKLVPQFEQALKNIVAIVSKAGGKPSDICKMTCFCKDRNQYLLMRKDLGKIWKEIMGNHYPCMSMIFVVDLLDHPALIEIEATAVIPE